MIPISKEKRHAVRCNIAAITKISPRAGERRGKGGRQRLPARSAPKIVDVKKEKKLRLQQRGHAVTAKCGSDDQREAPRP